MLRDDSQSMQVGYLSKGIQKIPHLNVFLGGACFPVKKITKENLSCIIGWGRKPSSKKARISAQQKSVDYVSLEDGFLRSLGLGVEGAVQHSLVVDSSGIYYDATRTSDLEQLILSTNALNIDDLQRSRHCIHLIKEQRLSKYNHAPDRKIFVAEDRPGVLVVDQTMGDASVQYGKATAESFHQMLELAIAENPGSEILVKIHPDVVAGKKNGYLLKAAQQQNCCILSDDVNPWSVLDVVNHVYVVSSQLGFEALLAGKKVTCFGIPFYSGWGLTDDRQRCERRGVSRSLEQIFYAAYIQYCRYVNPYTGIRCQLEDAIQLIAYQKYHLEYFSGRWLAGGFSSWKKRFIPDFLGSRAYVRFARNLNKSIRRLTPGDNVLVWSSSIDPELQSLCNKQSLRFWRMEDGFLRSVGLGADLVRPFSLVIDSSGIYYDATCPSDLENYLNNYIFDDDLLDRASRVRKQLVELKLSKYNVGVTSDLALPVDKRIILVPGQVETDASIAMGSPIIKTNQALLEQVRNDNPEAYIVYKPHPDVLGGARYGKQIDEQVAAAPYDLLVKEIGMPILLEKVDEVHTMSSLTGFEALLRGLKVVTYGLPFYAGWGLTADKLICKRRSRKLTLDQLVAGTLILYPVYVEPDSGQVCNIETIIDLINQRRDQVKGPSLKTRFFRFLQRFYA